MPKLFLAIFCYSFSSILLPGPTLSPIQSGPLLSVTVGPPQPTVVTQGDINVAFTVTVSNSGSAPTNGPVTMTADLPAGLTLQSLSGKGWACAGSTCTRVDALQSLSSYPPLVELVEVDSSISGAVTNSATVFGGGSATQSGQTSFAVTPLTGLGISVRHSGNPTPGGTVTYQLVVRSGVSASSTGERVTVTESVPSGLAITSMSGTGWTCANNQCGRDDVLQPSASYPPIFVTMYVSTSAPLTAINTATVVQGTASASGNDWTTVLSVASSVPVLSAGAVSGSPGDTIRVPLILSFHNPGTIGGLTFGVTVTPLDGNPPLTGPLEFAANTELDAQIAVTTGGTHDSIGVSDQTWISFRSTYHIGDVLVPVPAAANLGAAYLVNVHGISAATVGVSFPLNPGDDAAITLVLGTRYLVGDVTPHGANSMGNFGNARIDTLDLLAVLRAAVALPDASPPACSDRFDAMDVWPADNGDIRGGNGQINTLDVLLLLQRAVNVDLARPTRSPLSASCGAAQSAQEKRPPAGATQGILSLDVAEYRPGRIRAAIYLDAKEPLALAGLSLGFGCSRCKLHYVAPESQRPGIVDSAIPGSLALAWLSGWQAAAGSRVLLGYLEADSGSELRFFGFSGVARDGSEISLAIGPSTKRAGADGRKPGVHH